MQHSLLIGMMCKIAFAAAHSQDYDAAIQAQPDNVLALLRRGEVLAALKKPQVRRGMHPTSSLEADITGVLDVTL